MRCGAREQISPLTLKLRIRGDLMARAAVGAGAIQRSLAGWAVLVGLALFGFLGIKLFVKRTTALKLERVDGGGIVRLGNVHPDAGQAIVDAAAAT